jgi:hypothetical protein
VSDIFREVDEEVRREQYKKLWERYGKYLIALAVALVASVGGWRGWEWWQEKRAAEAGAAYMAAALLSEEDKHLEAETAFAKLAKEGPGSYRILAGLRAAAELGRRDPKAAVEAYEAMAGDTSIGTDFRDLARLRAGYLLVDSASYEDMRQRIEPLAAADRTFRHSARALLALAAWRAGDVAAVRRWGDLIVADPETPGSIRLQIEVLLTLLSADGKS